MALEVVDDDTAALIMIRVAALACASVSFAGGRASGIQVKQRAIYFMEWLIADTPLADEEAE